MIVLLRVLVIVYIIAINVYSFILVIIQKRQTEDKDETTVKDGKLFVAAMLGGATGIYVAMLTLKYRLQSLFLMVFMPILIVMNVYIIIVGFSNDFGLLVQSPL